MKVLGSCVKDHIHSLCRIFVKHENQKNGFSLGPKHRTLVRKGYVIFQGRQIRFGGATAVLILIHYSIVST